VPRRLLEADVDDVDVREVEANEAKLEVCKRFESKLFKNQVITVQSKGCKHIVCCNYKHRVLIIV
jgi:hypothetical protein